MKQQALALGIISVMLGNTISPAEEKEAEPPLDPLTGMKMAEHWELVRTHCTVCHSPKQFLQQRGTQSTWSDVIDWMQASGGLWPLDVETKSNIITYLAENYGPTGAYRRAPIPVSLLPENPYSTAAKEEFEAKKKAGLIPTAAPSSATKKP